MKTNDIMAQMERLVSLEKAKAYKAGFTDGIKFVSEPSESLIKSVEKATKHVLDQVDEWYGMSAEYQLVKDCLDAVLIDLKAAAHLESPKPMSDYWDDEYGDDL